jgi:hypothetical protein
MNTVEQVKTSISDLSASDQSDVLLYVLRLKYHATLEEIEQLAGDQADLVLHESVENLSYDALLERLHLLEGILEGLRDAGRHYTASHDEIKRRFESWRKK